MAKRSWMTPCGVPVTEVTAYVLLVWGFTSRVLALVVYRVVIHGTALHPSVRHAFVGIAATGLGIFLLVVAGLLVWAARYSVTRAERRARVAAAVVVMVVTHETPMATLMWSLASCCGDPMFRIMEPVPRDESQTATLTPSLVPPPVAAAGPWGDLGNLAGSGDGAKRTRTPTRTISRTATSTHTGDASGSGSGGGRPAPARPLRPLRPSGDRPAAEALFYLALAVCAPLAVLSLVALWGLYSYGGAAEIQRRLRWPTSREQWNAALGMPVVGPDGRVIPPPWQHRSRRRPYESDSDGLYSDEYSDDDNFNAAGPTPAALASAGGRTARLNPSVGARGAPASTTVQRSVVGYGGGLDNDDEEEDYDLAPPPPPPGETFTPPDASAAYAAAMAYRD